MKFILAIVCILTSFLACAQTDRTCGSAEIHIAYEKWFPRLKTFSDSIEEAKLQAFRIVQDVRRNIMIPVVVNVVLKDTSLITVEQVRDQIASLNQDYSGTNTDLSEVPDYFRKFVSGDTRIQFFLDTVVKFKTQKTRFLIKTDSGIARSSATDPVKFKETGGLAGMTPLQKLNIWVADIYYYDTVKKKDLDLAGFCPTPPVPLEMDGVMINYRYFGKSLQNVPGYNLGRTATHEIGHYLGLIHIWGDWFCQTDLVDDTPPQRGSQYGCNTGVIRDCNNSTHGCMYMNFMDYASDGCMHMFTAGQAERMRQQVALYRPALLFGTNNIFIDSMNWLENLSIIKEIRQSKGKANVVFSNGGLLDSTIVYVKEAKDTIWVKLEVLDSVVTTKGLKPGKLYEIKVQSAEHFNIPLSNLPSTFFVPNPRLFKKGRNLRILDF